MNLKSVCFFCDAHSLRLHHVTVSVDSCIYDEVNIVKDVPDSPTPFWNEAACILIRFRAKSHESINISLGSHALSICSLVDGTWDSCFSGSLSNRISPGITSCFKNPRAVGSWFLPCFLQPHQLVGCICS